MTHPSKARWRAANKEHVAAYNVAYNAENAERLAESRRSPEARAAALVRSAVWNAAHPEKRKAAEANFRRRNPGRNTVHGAAHKAQKILAKPAWANDFFISEAYALARLRTRVTGVEWQVDHIVPLRSPIVCGLHCEANLRVITKAENCRKRNRVEEPHPVGHRTFAAAEVGKQL